MARLRYRKVLHADQFAISTYQFKAISASQWIYG